MKKNPSPFDGATVDITTESIQWHIRPRFRGQFRSAATGDIYYPADSAFDSTGAEAEMNTSSSPPAWLEKCRGKIQTAWEFCEGAGIESAAETAVGLVKQYFSVDTPIVDVSTDPEGESEWLVVSFHVHGEIDDVLDSYYRMKDEWVRQVPKDVRNLVSFSYDID
jgi:hypothetical protein